MQRKTRCDPEWAGAFGPTSRSDCITRHPVSSRSSVHAFWTPSLEHWRANITTGLDPKLADNPQVMLDNPLGLFVKNVTWTQIVGGAK